MPTPDEAFAAGCQALAGIAPHANYQQDGIKWQLGRELGNEQGACRGGILADEPGLGKTITMLTTMLANPRWPTLVFAPVSCVDEWYHAIHTYCKGTRALKLHKDFTCLPRNVHVLVAPISCLQRGYGRASAAEALPPCLMPTEQWKRIVFDEAHLLKNRETKTYANLMRVAEAVDAKWALTGTPTSGKPSDLLSLGAFVDPSLQSIGPIRDAMLRRTKDDVAAEGKVSLAAFHMHVELLDLTLVEREAYDALLKLLRKRRPQGTRGMQASLHELRQLCTHPRLVLAKSGPIMPEAARQPGFQSTKLARVVGLVTSKYEADHKILVLCQYRAEMALLQECLAQARVPCMTFHGGTPMAARHEIVKGMRDDAINIVLLMQMQAGGVGINLERVSVVIVLTPDYDPMMQLQAVSRAHRLTTRQPVHCYVMACRDTIEHRTVAKQYAKGTRITSLTNDGSWQKSLGLDLLKDELSDVPLHRDGDPAL
ncbi:P-loop containing nucleoside triphosphate hydrolase protein [Scenedesmus sp. NREL 46B-D3]|nr:P-loop containing nucleoside triphosphate hydrolase protein [Scenedesmus sp. NREL 46B-D3]